MEFLTPYQVLMRMVGEGTITPALSGFASLAVSSDLTTALLVSVGIFGSAILDRFLGDRNAPDDSSGDPLLDGDDSLDGGMDDGFGDFDDMDGMDDWDDPFGEGDDGDSTDELDHRLGELEDEVARLSSTVNTVRSENTEISQTVDDIGENVRKLLDIYEMVTRGINPFVDDVQPGSGGFEDGSLGLFDTEEEDDEEELDGDIASADAEGFFDDDLLDDDFDEGEGFDDADFDLDDADGTEDSDMDTEIDDGGGKTFAELKDEYDSGTADWAGEGEGDEADADAALEGEFDDEAGFDDEDEFGVDDASTDVAFGDEEEFEAGDEFGVGAGDGFDFDTELEDGPEEESAVEAAESDEGTLDDGGFDFDPEAESSAVDAAESTASDSESPKPYLTALPESYVGDLLVMEWLEYLVDNADVVDAARAVRYYERIDWISRDVADELSAFLVGFGRVNVAEAERPGTAELSLAHHVRSLEYVRTLGGPQVDALALARRGGRDGF